MRPGRLPALRLALLLALALVLPRAQAEGASDEYRLKVAFLYHFAQFVDWPDSAFAGPGSPFVMCVLGENRFGPDLQTLTTRSVRAHPIELRSLRRTEQMSECHLVYAEDWPPGGQMPAAGLLERPLLLVSSRAGALRAGATIEFVLVQQRVRWLLNLEQARRAGLKVSAKLIELALPTSAAGG